MTTTRRALRWPAIGIVAAALAAPGCGPGAPGEIVGAVRLQGRAVSSGFVTFVAADGVPTSALIRDGAYRIAAAPVGPAKIIVVDHNQHAPAGLLNPTGGPAHFSLPERYGRPQMSGLTWQVKQGKQTCDIDLLP